MTESKSNCFPYTSNLFYQQLYSTVVYHLCKMRIPAVVSFSYLLILDPVLGFTDTKSRRIQAPCEAIFALTQGFGFHDLLKQRKEMLFLLDYRTK
ncbi:hypothetical protein AV530_019630 [Patagioenas fasciata monilis]|uniref:Uncharacterized protein n=1 Tax=Patagioenas fasciata monilis TaxID=372326 RepID=A0A1V4JE16_PATFA|nr:hypothetical protein AV530_019630 [Patagioenas fasciata monilis]